MVSADARVILSMDGRLNVKEVCNNNKNTVKVKATTKGGKRTVT